MEGGERMRNLLKTIIVGLAIMPTSIVGAPARAGVPDDPRQILGAIDARSGFEGIDENRGTYVQSAKVVRFRYWRGPCMLYWSESGREGGVIHWQAFDGAALGKGRLMLTNADRTEAFAMTFANTMSEDDRLEAVGAALRVIESCKPSERQSRE